MSSVHRRPSCILRLLSSVLCPFIVLGTSSATAVQIVLPRACGEKAHRIAAQELARYWQEICGERLAIVPAATPGEKAIRFAVLDKAATSAAAAIVTSKFVSFTASCPQLAKMPSKPALCSIDTR